MESIAVITGRYQRSGVIPGWRPARFMRLCKLLNARPAEVGALCAATEAEVEKWLAKGRFPPTVSLSLALIEAEVVRMRVGHKQQIL